MLGWFGVVPLDALDLVFGAKHQANALVQAGGLHTQHGDLSRAGAATGLFHDEADRIGFVQQAQAAGFAAERSVWDRAWVTERFIAVLLELRDLCSPKSAPNPSAFAYLLQQIME